VLLWCRGGESTTGCDRSVGAAHGGEHLDEQLVLGAVDPCGEVVEGVAGKDGNIDRGEERAVVDTLVGDEVDHHPGV
jgi:hypothetical protein